MLSPTEKKVLAAVIHELEHGGHDLTWCAGQLRNVLVPETSVPTQKLEAYLLSAYSLDEFKRILCNYAHPAWFDLPSPCSLVGAVRHGTPALVALGRANLGAILLTDHPWRAHEITAALDETFGSAS